MTLDLTTFVVPLFAALTALCAFGAAALLVGAMLSPRLTPSGRLAMQVP